eukprot:238515-Chlamydomonas_euryale.AAC.2
MHELCFAREWGRRGNVSCACNSCGCLMQVMRAGGAGHGRCIVHESGAGANTHVEYHDPPEWSTWMVHMNGPSERFCLFCVHVGAGPGEKGARDGLGAPST